MSAGAKSRARIYGAGVMVALAGCNPPAVAARAVWIGQGRTEDGDRTLHTYAGGTITTSRLRANVGDTIADELPMLVELGPRGQGALVRAVDDGWLHELGGGEGLRVGYVDLERLRALSLWVPPEIDSVEFTARGDALVWREGCPQILAVMPLAPGLPLGRERHGDITTLAPLRRAIGGIGIEGGEGRPALPACDAEAGRAVASAADAPVVYVLASRREGDDLRVDEGATIEALRYPAAADAAMDLEVVAQGGLPMGQIPLRLPALRCGGGPCGVVAVDPAGEGVSVAVYGGDCRMLRFDAATGETACAVPTSAPAGLQSERLLAAISSDHYVFREGLTIHRYAWRTGVVTSRPLPGEANEVFTRVSQDGRAVVIGTIGGTALRVDAERIDLLSVERQPCTNPQAPVMSPSGRWLAWTCTPDMSEVPSFLDDSPNIGDVVRVSAIGLERYQGVPMWALAIDDSGDLLLHSRRNRAFSYELQLPPIAPRNLYVLASDGELARIDALEPEPELMIGLSSGTYHWISAQAF